MYIAVLDEYCYPCVKHLYNRIWRQFVKLVHLLRNKLAWGNFLLLTLAAVYFLVVLFCLLPAVHWLPWWIPFAIFFGGNLYDNLSTLLFAVRYGGRKNFAQNETNEEIVHCVERFGLVGIFVAPFSPRMLWYALLLAAILAWPPLILIPFNLARPLDITAIPLLIIGCLKSLAGLSNTVYIFRKHRLINILLQKK